MIHRSRRGLSTLYGGAMSLDLLAALAVAGLAASAIAAHVAYRRYVLAPRALADEIALMAGPNRSHRLVPAGGGGLRRIAAAVNRLAQRLDAAESAVEARVDVAV
ncbi:MAG: hypothetical protein ACXWJU_10250, partial [Hyphomicrobium sp.]